MAIVQKFVNCSTSTTPNQQIPMDRIVAFDKYQVGTDVNDSSKQEVGILFSLDTLSPVRQMKLVYPGSTSAATILRDASYAAVKAASAQTTV